MGIWKELKKCVNSTVGTSNFKPLDKLILEDVTVGAADAPVLKVLSTEEFDIASYRNENDAKLIGSFSSSKSGSVRCRIKVLNNGRTDNFSESSSKHSIYIYIGDSSGTFVRKTIYQLSYITNDEQESPMVWYTDISVKAGETYTIKLGAQYESLDSYYFTHLQTTICASGIRDSIIT